QGPDDVTPIGRKNFHLRLLKNASRQARWTTGSAPKHPREPNPWGRDRALPGRGSDTPRNLLYHEYWGVGPANIVRISCRNRRPDIRNFAFSTPAINRLYWVDSWVGDVVDHDEGRRYQAGRHQGPPDGQGPHGLAAPVAVPCGAARPGNGWGGLDAAWNGADVAAGGRGRPLVFRPGRRLRSPRRHSPCRSGRSRSGLFPRASRCH